MDAPRAHITSATATAAAPWASASAPRDELIAALVDAVGRDYVATDPDVTTSYARDMMPLAPAGTPLAVVRPGSTAEVAAVVTACAAAGVPIVPRGAGSGLSGAANAVDGAVTVVMTRMNRIVEIDRGNRLAVETESTGPTLREAILASARPLRPPSHLRRWRNW